MQSALSAVVRVQVSSVLNRDTASYGKQHLVDRNDQTCWNSDQGLPQSITVTMSHPVDICGVRIVFQGGFVGSRLQAWVKSCGSDTFALQKEFDAEDRNGPQDFLFDVAAVERIKIVFTQSSDFFGRITIYHLDILTSTPPTEPA
ncbi:F5/8 type C domain-containing protein [Plasmodiophora brassicae]